MKILRIIYDWPPPWTGLAPAPYEMTLAQTKLGHEIDIFCGRWPFAGPLERIEGVNFKTFIREPLAGTLMLTTAPLMFLSYLKWRRSNEVDVIHSHGHFAGWIYVYRAFLKKVFPKAKELKTPLVVQFHNTVKGRAERLKKEGKKISPVSKWLSWPLMQKSDEYAVKAADALVFVSEELKKEAIKYYGASPNKCFVVESGVNASLFTPINLEEREKTRHELGLDQKDKIILNNGAMVERKNIHILIESLVNLPKEFKLLLVGPPGSNEYEAKLSKIIIDNSLDSRVIRVGYTPYPQVQIAFQAADIFVLPSSWEGLPKVVLQSLACGVPVLASGFETQQVLGGLVYLREITPKAVADGVLKILEEGRPVDIAKVRNNYSWSVMARKVDNIYSRILTY